ncbi:prolyl oligopeptidase family serine peptidase [Tautonia plasticadhaerens]|uniref:Prolyl oligopeptidase family protein n=1 Tax=Tautonia plasticadhaerens TaxID=2527974 RepID=A0A518H5D6_9BACT|nr:prolyl oligopeptidase family serine peptidase [Tautonia plasticadhaerens]QDV36057.1 Prolyl oligopeptidase family protein [Tautonia plasticadhaerens]
MTVMTSRWTLALALLGAPAVAQDDRHPPTEEQLATIRERSAELADRLDRLEASLIADEREVGDAFADVAVFLKAAEWIDRHGEYFEEGSAAWTLDALDRGLARAEQAIGGDRPWTTAGGGVVRGYVSKVDGSVQPYAVYRPEGLDREARVRLDVVLHGRNARLNEVRFIRDHEGKATPEGIDERIVLHVYGRGNNAYRWAGESDVFEAIAAVRRTERIDPERIVLRGFSMGGAGAWHLGLHHPSLWAAVEAGAGFSETIHYAKLEDIPEYQRKALHIYDAADYALNASNVPIVGYGGEEDPQLRASENVVEALRVLGFETTTEGLQTRAEGLEFLRVVGAGMGHRVDEASRAVIDAFVDEHAERGVAFDRPRVRFVTYTAKYHRAAWIQVEELIEHYARATVEAEVDPESRGVVEVATENVAVLAVERQVADRARIDGVELPLADAAGSLLPSVYYRRRGDSWFALDYDESREIQLNATARKRPGIQGPIDDAFTGSFLCVRGTGPAWNPRVQRWAEERLDCFASEWDEWMRGDLPIKDDADVTAEDLRRSHLVLFGDPGSNRLIGQLLPELPLAWTRDRVGFLDPFEAADHAPAMIAPNPLNSGRYVVVNSGHTFGADAFRGTNALLYPRLGDYAVFRVDDDGGEVVSSGYFDESWRLEVEGD